MQVAFSAATAHGRQDQFCLVWISTLQHGYFLGLCGMSIGVPRDEHGGRVCCRVSSSPSDLSQHVPHGRRRMVAGEDSRVDFGMAEALALGTLALHRGRRPGGCEFGSDLGEQAASPAEARTLAPAVPCVSSCVGHVQG